MFLGRFLRKPMQTGAVAPSSVALADVITGGIGLEHAGRVVELGPGTGVFTDVIARKTPPAARIVAVEVEPQFADLIRRRFPHLHVVTGTAEHLPQHLGPDAGRVDCIVSSLPWAAFTADTQRRLLDAIVESLAPRGWLATFAYRHAAWLPTGRGFRRLLDEHFGSVRETPTVWRNLPPAFVYRCQK